jgi:hypothetical protein
LEQGRANEEERAKESEAALGKGNAEERAKDYARERSKNELA